VRVVHTYSHKVFICVFPYQKVIEDRAKIT